MERSFAARIMSTEPAVEMCVRWTCASSSLATRIARATAVSSAAFEMPGRPRDDLRDKSGRVDRGLGVRHRADRREPAAQRGLRAGRDRLRLLEARLAEVRVQIDEAARDEVALALQFSPVH